MLIDWFTVAAQALNFAILVWLMKRFLYRPVLDAIDERERHIAAALADAEAKQADANRQRDEFRRSQGALDEQRGALMQQAQQEAESERQRLLAEVRSAAETARHQQQQALRDETRRLQQSLARRTQEEVFAIARKVLADLASVSVDERAVAAFEQRLQCADEPTRAAMAGALDVAAGAALVRTAFELSAQQKAALQAAVDKAFARPVALRFETAPDLVGGIELSANGHKLAWSVAGYLASLQQGVSELAAPPAASETGRR